MNESMGLGDGVGVLIGPGAVLTGSVVYMTGEPGRRIVIQGQMSGGDIRTDGIVEIGPDAVVQASAAIECNEIHVSGTLKGEGVTVKASLLVLKSQGRIDVQTLCLPPGGLEQLRGSILNAQLQMTSPAANMPAVAPPGKVTPASFVAAPVPAAPSLPVPAAIATPPVRSPFTESAFSSPSELSELSDPTKLALPSFGSVPSAVGYRGVDLPGQAPPPLRVEPPARVPYSLQEASRSDGL